LNLNFHIGDLASISINSFSIQNLAAITAVSSSNVMPGLSKAAIFFKFTIPIDISNYQTIFKVTGAGQFPFTTSTITTCSLKLFSLSPPVDRYDVNSLSHTCSVTMPDQLNIIFTITELKGVYPSGSVLLLYIYGVDSTLTGQAVAFNLKIQYAENGLVSDAMAET
jgi:hypothetical protein